MPVGSFASSRTPEGVHDLIGNVWEWTDSPMRAYSGGRALNDSLTRYRVIRGGAFNVPDSIATSWYRGYVPPVAAPSDLSFTGFRCAMTARASLPAAR
jgi:iron(II)-dependent oxidoreductase